MLNPQDQLFKKHHTCGFYRKRFGLAKKHDFMGRNSLLTGFDHTICFCSIKAALNLLAGLPFFSHFAPYRYAVSTYEKTICLTSSDPHPDTILTFFLAFSLASIQTCILSGISTFFLAFYVTSIHDRLSGIYSDILSGIYSDSDILSRIMSGP